MFQKILIANRGEIACRVAATAKRLGIQTVAVYSDADVKAKHVSACDEAISIGGNAPQDSYLRWDRIIAAARDTGAQAIHPGYGFLSENAKFAQACFDAGLVFIGPSPSAIRAMGLKAQSKQLMAQAAVPLVPGYHGEDQTPERLQREADNMGYPVLIKASAGGGGKGMRVVERAGDFATALQSCQREATSSFGDEAVLLEKYLQRPRHIEIQVFADSHGNCVHLFERDCSVQRRHQKVLEEAPAPGMTLQMRSQMGAAALAAARAVNYVGAGTVEFIVEQDQFFFMEMNTRLQVEHPVTEAITGLDLVEWQLRVAAGERLPLSQDQLQISGHAIEARICAENPDHNFLPATGDLAVLALPDCSSFQWGVGSVRVDSGVRQGDTITPFYDSMLAKLIVHGATRQDALAKLDAALAQTHVVGLNSNVQFLRHVVQSRSFALADLDTGLIPREQAQVFAQQRLALSLTVASAVACLLRQERAIEQANKQAHAGQWFDPWERKDGWRCHGVHQRRFDFEFQSQPHSAHLSYGSDGPQGSLLLTIGGDSAVLSWSSEGNTLALHFAGHSERVDVYRQGEVFHVFAAAGATQIRLVDALAHAGESHAESGRLSAPMPGKLLSFSVQVGDGVTKGQTLAVLEAMKMEHSIVAPADGVVGELLYSPGDQVEEGAELLKLCA